MTDSSIDPRLAAVAGSDLPPDSDEAVEKFALRTRSPVAPDMVARAATDGSHDLESLLRMVAAGGTPPELDEVWGAVTARLLSLGPRPDAWERGAEVFEAVLRHHPLSSLSRRAATTWAQLLLRTGRDADLHQLLTDASVQLDDIDRWGLRADLANPWRRERDAAVSRDPESAWLEVFNEAHAEDGLDPVRLAPSGDTPYQRLSGTPRDTVDGELVTVVMSAYSPDRDILMAARSVLAQSWTNLELLVVDDASPPGSEGLLDEVEALDARVRVVRASRNGGTYEARNLALRTAKGRWISFQDSDDWTHPRRVEIQVRALLDDPGLLSCRTWTLRAFPDLTLTYVGYSPERLNASSLLLDRLEVVRLVGAFDATRKSADMELPLRLNAVRPGSHRDIRHPAPLAVTQLRSGSLSRTDAVPGWTRWTRLAYRDLYLQWHRRIATGRAGAVLPVAGRPFPLPDPTWAPERPAPVEPRRLDAVVLGDLRAAQPRAIRTTALATALASTGLRAALAHAETPDPLTTKRPDLLPEAMAAVIDARVALTHASEPDATSVLVVTDPAAVLHLEGAQLTADAVLVLADEPPTKSAGWSVAAVDRRCMQLFGRLPRWGGPLRSRPDVRSALPPDRLVDADLLTVVDPCATSVGCGRPVLTRPAGPPVVGHHLPDRRAYWPGSARDVRAAYLDAGHDVHVLHGVVTATRVLGKRLAPPSWCSFAGTGMTPRELLTHLDVYVYQGQWDAVAEVAALEAQAAGLPCVLPTAAASAMRDGSAEDGHGSLVRCVEPAGVAAAVEELMDVATADPVPPGGRPVTEVRLRAWAGAVRHLTTPATTSRGALA